MKRTATLSILWMFGLLATALFWFPKIMHAQTPCGTFPYPACPTSNSLNNPLAFGSIQEFLVAILNVIIVIATPIVILFIIFSGFKYVTARGNPTKVQEATKSLTYAIIGGILIIGAVAISQIISNLVGAFSTP